MFHLYIKNDVWVEDHRSSKDNDTLKHAWLSRCVTVTWSNFLSDPLTVSEAILEWISSASEGLFTWLGMTASFRMILRHPASKGPITSLIRSCLALGSILGKPLACLSDAGPVLRNWDWLSIGMRNTNMQCVGRIAGADSRKSYCDSTINREFGIIASHALATWVTRSASIIASATFCDRDRLPFFTDHSSSLEENTSTVAWIDVLRLILAFATGAYERMDVGMPVIMLV